MVVLSYALSNNFVSVKDAGERDFIVFHLNVFHVIVYGVFSMSSQSSGESTGTGPESHSLAQQECIPCRGGVPPLEPAQRTELLAELDQWEVVNEHHLSKTFVFPNFSAALDWTNRIGELAERENHHPDIYLSWGKVKVDIWTHKIDNLTKSDFILAAKIDELSRS